MFCLQEEYNKGQMSSSLLRIKGTHHQCNLSLLMLNLITWAKIEFVRFLHSKVTIFPSFPCCCLWKVVMCSPTLRSEELWSTSLRVNFLHKLFGIILPTTPVCSSPFVYSFNHLFMSIWIHGYYFILGLWSNTPFLLLLKLFCIWLLKALSLGVYILTYLHHHLCF